MAAERVLCVAAARRTRRSALVLRDGAPPEVAHLRAAPAGGRRAVRGATDRVPGGAVSRAAAYPAGSGHGTQYGPDMAGAGRGLGDVSSVPVPRPDRHCHGSLRGGDAAWHSLARLDGASAALSARDGESGGDPGA